MLTFQIYHEVHDGKECSNLLGCMDLSTRSYLS